jgi:hypothetical protein
MRVFASEIWSSPHDVLGSRCLHFRFMLQKRMNILGYVKNWKVRLTRVRVEHPEDFSLEKMMWAKIWHGHNNAVSSVPCNISEELHRMAYLPTFIDSSVMGHECAIFVIFQSRLNKKHYWPWHGVRGEIKFFLETRGKWNKRTTYCCLLTNFISTTNHNSFRERISPNYLGDLE